MRVPLRLRVFGIVLPALILPVIARECVPTTTDLAYWIIDILLNIVVPIACLFVVHRIGIAPNSYGLSFTRGGYTWAELVSLSFLCTLVFLASVVIFNVVGSFADESARTSATPVDLLERGMGGVAIAYHAVSAGVFEEILFRGILGFVFLSERRRTKNIVAYVVCSSLAFLGTHQIANAADIVTFLYFGFSAAMMYVLLRNLWPIIIAHTSYDLVILIWSKNLGMSA